jgi:hypothetical protein
MYLTKGIKLFSECTEERPRFSRVLIISKGEFMNEYAKPEINEE